MANLLSIYLNDHLAGSTAGVELVRRLCGSNRDSPDFGSALEQLRSEIEADRATLERVMEELEIERSTVKPAAAWLGEKLGRLKLNGQLHGYSPLSRLVELEGLLIGISGKTALWSALGSSLGPRWRSFDFEQLEQRAAAQLEKARELHLLAVGEALTAQAATA